MLLPQVPLEFKWDAETFLGHLCIKAALTPDQWLGPDVKIYSFKSEIFTEESPMGAVKRVGIHEKKED